MLQETYMFKVQPALVKGFNTVVLLREDFENLLNLANLWLSHNPEDQYHKISSSTSATSNEDSGNIYICNDQRQFITNHFHYSMGTEEELVGDKLALVITDIYIPR